MHKSPAPLDARLESFCDVPACQRVRQSDIGNQEIDLFGFTKHCERASAVAASNTAHPSCRRPLTISSRINQSSSTTRTVTALRAACKTRLHVAPGSPRPKRGRGASVPNRMSKPYRF